MSEKKRSTYIDWEDLRVLIELAEHGSLSATARELGVTHATIGRRMANLEKDLSQPLFIRASGRYVLTEGGRRILELAGPMAASAEAVMRAASSMEARLTGPVRIAGSESSASYIVMPAIARIRAKYPDLDLEIIVTPSKLNLARSDADIAVSLIRPDPTAGLIGIKVADLGYHLYASKDYLKGRPPELLEYIGYPDEVDEWPEFDAFASAIGDGRIALRTNHLNNRIVATRLGMGIAMLPDLMASQWPELVRVTNSEPVMKREAYLIVHEDMQDVPRIRACLELLAEAIIGKDLRRQR